MASGVTHEIVEVDRGIQQTWRMMNMQAFDSDIADAIRNLYRVFRRYHVRFPLDACDHCVDESHQRQLADKPLEQLTSDDLSYYAFKAITTFGSARDFKHFLPRIFELITREQSFPINSEIVFGKLSDASWKDWPPMEQTAIDRFLRAMWRHVLESNDAAMFVGDCLGSIARVVEGLEEYLTFWFDAMDRSSVARIRTAEFLCEDFSFKDDVWPFWEESLDRQQQVVFWLRSDGTATRVRRALTDWIQMPEGRGYDYVLDEYERWRVQNKT